MWIKTCKKIACVLKLVFKNPNSTWAKDFARELETDGKAQRNRGGGRMRGTRINVNIYLQAKKVSGGYRVREVVSGHGWPTFKGW